MLRNNNIKNDELKDHIISIKRITKVVKGGRKLRFSSLVIVGNKKNYVGFGTGKAQEVPEAIRKAIENAKKNLIYVPVVNFTIPYEIIGKFGSSSILMKPSIEGSGISGGNIVRIIFELAGIFNITSKSFGSNTPINLVRAVIDGLLKLKKIEYIKKIRKLN